MLIEGGPLAEKGRYGFYETNGKIPLPQDTEAWIIVVGERDSTMLFATNQFITTTRQSLSLQLISVTHEQFERQVSQMGLPEFSLKSNDTKSGIDLIKVIGELKNAEQLKPRNCDCNCVGMPLEDAEPTPEAIGEDVPISAK